MRTSNTQVSAGSSIRISKSHAKPNKLMPKTSNPSTNTISNGPGPTGLCLVFRMMYDRGDFPIAVDYDARGKRIKWKVDTRKLDLQYYLPLFFTGVSETEDPYSFLAEQGIVDMLRVGGADKIIPIIPQLVMPIKRALNTRDPRVIKTTLLLLQELVQCGPGVGVALVPFYRQLLPVFNQFKNRNVNLGDGIYYAQRKRENLGDLIEETLEKFERSGGDQAFVGIKYMIPTYESCLARH